MSFNEMLISIRESSESGKVPYATVVFAVLGLIASAALLVVAF